MQANRRKFLGIFGGAVAAGPSAVKAAAESAAMDISGIGVGGGDWTCNEPAVGSSRSLSEAMKLCGVVPDFLKKQWMESAKSSANNRIRYDIAVLRSVSLPAKVSMQIDRDYRANEREAWSVESEARKKWYRKWVYGRSILEG